MREIFEGNGERKFGTHFSEITNNFFRGKFTNNSI